MTALADSLYLASSGSHSRTGSSVCFFWVGGCAAGGSGGGKMIPSMMSWNVFKNLRQWSWFVRIDRASVAILHPLQASRARQFSGLDFLERLQWMPRRPHHAPEMPTKRTSAASRAFTMARSHLLSRALAAMLRRQDSQPSLSNVRSRINESSRCCTTNSVWLPWYWQPQGVVSSPLRAVVSSPLRAGPPTGVWPPMSLGTEAVCAKHSGEEESYWHQ